MPRTVTPKARVSRIEQRLFIVPCLPREGPSLDYLGQYTPDEGPKHLPTRRLRLIKQRERNVRYCWHLYWFPVINEFTEKLDTQPVSSSAPSKPFRPRI